MNWGRAKTILLVLFLLTDLFLFVVLLQTRMNVQNISDQTVSEVVSILQEHGIQIEPEQIPVKRMPNQSVIMRNFFRNPEETAKTILGEDAQATSVFPEQYEYLFESQRGKLLIQKSGFSFESKKAAMPFKTENLPGESNIRSHVLGALSRVGIRKGTAEIYEITGENGLLYCSVRPLYKQQPIYGVSMSVVIDSEGVINMEGRWFVAEDVEESGQEGLLDVTTVLAGLIFEEKVAPLAIATVSHGFYMADEFLDSREIAAVPVYVITEVGGARHMYDARVGIAVE